MRQNRKHQFTTTIVVLLAVYAASCFANTEQWQTISLAGSKIGFRHLEQQQTASELISRETLVITVSQPGASDTTTTTALEYREDLNGKPLAMSKTVTSATVNHAMRATVTAGVLHVTQDELGGKTQDYLIPKPFYLAAGLRQQLRNGAGQSAPLKYFTWNFSSQQFDYLQLTLSPYKAPQNPAYAWKIQRQNLQDNTRFTEIYTDAAFQPLSEISRSGGNELRINTCAQDCAQADFQPETHVYRQLISSPYKISDSALRGKIRYRLLGSFSDMPPTTNEQAVKPIAGGVEITVCPDCGTEAPPSPEALKDRLQTNYWLASDEAAIRDTIKNLLTDKDIISSTAKMRRLSRFVSRHMSSEASYSGYATALEAFRSQQGDCTEHALLLASLARAAGIPSRVVFGLAYNNERFLGRKYVFVPHAWVQAWTGEKWQSFDSGLGKFTAGHIALGTSNGEQSEILKVNKQLHQLSISSAVQIKNR